MQSASSKGGWRISGRMVGLIIVAAVVSGAVLTAASFYLNAAPTGTVSMAGKLYINSSGQLNGDSPFAATYNVTLATVSGKGTMNLTLLSSSDDVLSTHDFTVTALVATPHELNMSIDGNNATLSWVSNSTVWKQYNESYIASWGPNAPANEMVGILSAQDFPGLPTSYYIFLSVTVPAQPQDTIPFIIRPAG